MSLRYCFIYLIIYSKVFFRSEIIIHHSASFDYLYHESTAIINILLFRRGGRLYTSESDVYIRQILTFKVFPWIKGLVGMCRNRKKCNAGKHFVRTKIQCTIKISIVFLNFFEFYNHPRDLHFFSFTTSSCPLFET